MKKKQHIHSKGDATYINKKNDLTNLRVLIVEDHALMQDAIKNVFKKLSGYQNKYSFTMETASNCKEAYEKISQTNNFYDLILLDIQLTPYPSKKLFSGEDIGLWIKQTLHLSSKIIVITIIKDNFRVQNIIKSINPDGFLVKEDITPESLLDALKKIFKSPPYYSESIAIANQKVISSNIFITPKERQLLYELSQGAKVKELIEILGRSKSYIQKYKARLMDVFDVSDNSTRELIQKAKEQGFL